jgi:putative transcriptional regulator
MAISSAKQGEDVAISNIEGLVEFAKGQVTILQIPVIQRGGSKQVDLGRLKDQIAKSEQVGAIGIEALIALRRLSLEPRYFYGVTQAAMEAARCGLSFIIVCTDDAIPELIKRLQQEGLNFEIVDLRRNKTTG